MNIIVGLILFSIVFPINEKDNISFQYGMLGRLESKNNQIIELQDSSTIIQVMRLGSMQVITKGHIYMSYIKDPRVNLYSFIQKKVNLLIMWLIYLRPFIPLCCTGVL